MNRERRSEIILGHMHCLIKYFPFDDPKVGDLRKEVCRGCSDYIHCINTWQPWLEGEIRGILDSEFRAEVGACVRFLSGQLKGQMGRITKVGAVHNNTGFYCWVKVEGRVNGEVWVRYPEQIEIIK